MKRRLLYVGALAAIATCWRAYSGATPQPDGPVYAEVIFRKGEVVISQEGRTSLTNLAGTLKMWNGAAARIEGHAAISEPLDAGRKMEISEMRANAVHDFLRTACGLSNVLEVVGYSDSRPKIQRATPDEGKNARVEVYVRAPAEKPEGIE